MHPLTAGLDSLVAVSTADPKLSAFMVRYPHCSIIGSAQVVVLALLT